MKTSQVLQGKSAVVTGAGQGIGSACAIALAEAGAAVCLNDWGNFERAENVVQIIRDRGGEAFAYEADAGDGEQVAHLVGTVIDRFGGLDIAVANAAYSDRGPMLELPLEALHRTVNVTMWGPVHLLRSAAAWMRNQGVPGCFVAISSPHAFVPVPRALPYNMSKAAVEMMVRTAAIELAEYRIRVNAVQPGWINTPGERKFASDEQIAAAANKLPWGRLGTPEEIARGVVFLCDPASEYITGTCLLIDGGVTLPWWASRGSGVPE